MVMKPMKLMRNQHPKPKALKPEVEKKTTDAMAEKVVRTLQVQVRRRVNWAPTTATARLKTEVVSAKPKEEKDVVKEEKKHRLRRTHHGRTCTAQPGPRASKAHRSGDEDGEDAETKRELYFGDDLDTAKDIQTGLRPGNEFRSLRTVTSGIHKKTIKSECQYNGCPSYRLRFAVEPTGTSRATGFACVVGSVVLVCFGSSPVVCLFVFCSTLIQLYSQLQKAAPV